MNSIVVLMEEWNESLETLGCAWKCLWWCDLITLCKVADT